MWTNRIWLFVAPALVVVSAWAQPTIDASNWPYGADQIGNYWQYFNTSATVPVDIVSINPYQQGGSWDFTTGPTGTTAGSEIRAVAAAPAPPPANTTFVEYQTSGGNIQWLYADEAANGVWARGFAQAGTIYSYNAPFYNVYHYPMTMGTSWSSTWTWTVQGITVQSVRNNEVVGWGTVNVPFGGPLPCLVIRQAYSDYGEFMGVPIVNSVYKLYEWICPGFGSVATIQSVNQETNWNFSSAEGFYRLYNTNVGGDVAGPLITAVTQLADSPGPGPYAVNATIADASGVDSAAVLYSVAGGAYVARGPESIDGDVFMFHIPQLSGQPVQQIRYYIWTVDGSPNQNMSVNPPGAPGVHYSFNWIADNIAPLISNVTVWPSPTNFTGPYPVSGTITDDNGVLFASLHYRFGNGAWQELPADSHDGSLYQFTIPAISATTIIRYYLEAVDNSGYFNTGYYPTAGASGPIVFQAVYTTAVPPQAVTDLTAYRQSNNIRLNWSDVTQDVDGNAVTVSHYEIWRGLSSDGTDWVVIGTSPTSDFIDSDVVSIGAMYIYNVRAIRP